MHGAVAGMREGSSTSYRLSIAVELDSPTHHDSGVAVWRSLFRGWHWRLFLAGATSRGAEPCLLGRRSVMKSRLACALVVLPILVAVATPRANAPAEADV